MEAEFVAAERLLLGILSKRGEAISEKLLSKLMKWARGCGYFPTPASLFLRDEWRRVGEQMWAMTIDENDKPFRDTKTVWKTIINTLNDMKAESTVAAAAVTALSQEAAENSVVVQQPESLAGKTKCPPRPPCFAFPAHTEQPIARKGITGQECKSLLELGSSTSPSAPPLPTIYPPLPRPTQPTMTEGEPCRPPPPSACNPQGVPLPPEEGLPAPAGEEPTPSLTSLQRAMQQLEHRSTAAVQRLEQLLAGAEGRLAVGGGGQTRLQEAIAEGGSGPCAAGSGRRWTGVIRDALIEGGWQPVSLACPVVRNEQGESEYQKYELKTVQQAVRTIKENGLKSEMGRQTLRWLHTMEPLLPLDCDDLSRMLLTPSQHLIWAREWARLARELENRPRPPGDPLEGLRADMILGTGHYSSVHEQLRYPGYLIDRVVDTALRAYDAVPEAGTTPSFTAVKQGLTEGFDHFVDRLHNAVRSSMQLAPENMEAMFRLLAFENANEKTKRVLATLPKSADVADMLELVSRAEQGNQAKHVAGAVQAAIAPIVAAVQSKPLGKRQAKTAGGAGRAGAGSLEGTRTGPLAMPLAGLPA